MNNIRNTLKKHVCLKSNGPTPTPSLPAMKSWSNKSSQNWEMYDLPQKYKAPLKRTVMSRLIFLPYNT